MSWNPIIPVRRAPWGRKKFLAPLPILSVVLMAAALAAPALLHTSFTFFHEGGLTISAQVQNVIHSAGPSGKIVGLMTVTNAHPFAITILAASASITSGTIVNGQFTADPNPVSASIPLPTPLVVPANTTLKTPFSGNFTGSILQLTTASSFLIEPYVKWIEVHSPTDIVGPFTYGTTKVCPTPFSLLPGNPDYWTTQCH